MKAIVITEKGLPVAFAEVREYQTKAEAEEMRKECEKNARAKAEAELKEKEALDERVKALEKRNDTLTKAIKLVLGFGGDLDEVEKELTGGESNG